MNIHVEDIGDLAIGSDIIIEQTELDGIAFSAILVPCVDHLQEEQSSLS